MRSALKTPTSPAPSWWDRPWLAVLAILALAFNVRPTAIAIGPVLQQVQADFAMSSAAAGLLTSLPALCFAFFGAAAAVLAARFGPHRVTVVALLCVGIGSGARALVHDRVVFFLLSIVALAGMAVANVLLPSLVKRHFPTRVSYITALYSTSLQVGVVIASIATVPLSQALGSWHDAFLIFALIALVSALPWIVLTRTKAGEKPQNTEHSHIKLRQVARTPLGWFMAIFFGFQSAQAYSVFGWLSSIYQQAGISETHAGLLLGIATGVGLPLSFLFPAYTARNPSPYGLLIALSGCSIIGYAGLWLAPATVPWLWAVFIAFGTSSFPLILAAMGLRARTPEGTAALSGFTQSVGYLIAALGPLLIGVLRELTGSFTWPLISLLLMTIPLTICGLYAFRPHYLEDELSSRTQ